MKNKYAPAILLIGFIVITILSLFIGRYPLNPSKILEIILGTNAKLSQNDRTVLLIIRLPRIIAVLLVGGGLAVSGVALQGLFKNPLISPYVLGVSSGSGFGAALAILLSFSPLMIQTTAFLFGVLAVFIAILIGGKGKGSSLPLVLAGIIVGALFGALISFIKYVADPFEKLPAIVFWLMGSFSSVTYNEILISLPFMLVGITTLFLIRWRINILAMGEEESVSLGENPKLLRSIIIVSTSLITAASVSISGIIGWIGLVIPHIVRILVGPNNKYTIPLSIILGGGYLLLIDDVSRTLFPIEIPIGILTAIIGAPVFAYLLKFRRSGWAG